MVITHSGLTVASYRPPRARLTWVSRGMVMAMESVLSLRLSNLRLGVH